MTEKSSRSRLEYALILGSLAALAYRMLSPQPLARKA